MIVFPTDVSFQANCGSGSINERKQIRSNIIVDSIRIVNFCLKFNPEKFCWAPSLSSFANSFQTVSFAFLISIGMWQISSCRKRKYLNSLNEAREAAKDDHKRLCKLKSTPLAIGWSCRTRCFWLRFIPIDCSLFLLRVDWMEGHRRRQVCTVQNVAIKLIAIDTNWFATPTPSDPSLTGTRIHQLWNNSDFRCQFSNQNPLCNWRKWFFSAFVVSE